MNKLLLLLTFCSAPLLAQVEDVKEKTYFFGCCERVYTIGFYEFKPYRLPSSSVVRASIVLLGLDKRELGRAEVTTNHGQRNISFNRGDFDRSAGADESTYRKVLQAYLTQQNEK